MSSYEPHHHMRNIKPSAAFIPDPSLPEQEDTDGHVDRIMRASRRKGFPVAPCPRFWP